MISSLAKYVGNNLAKLCADSNILSDRYTNEEIEAILIYQVTNILKTIIWILLLTVCSSIMCISLIHDNTYFYSTAIFLLVIVLFRRMFGGYHHESENICLIISTIVPLTGGFLALKLDFNIYMILLVYLFSFITAFNKKVVDSPQKRFEEGNKILTLELKERFFKLGVTLLSVTFFIHLAVFYKGYGLTSNTIALGVGTSFLNLYFGK